MIEYLLGDATFPEGEGNKIITHVCNDIGGWGRGFVLSLSKRWSTPELNYRRWSIGYPADRYPPFKLGETQFTWVEPEICVANMIAQRDICVKDGIPPIRYDALRKCLGDVAIYAVNEDASIHMPRIGCGLAGGDWSVVEEIVNTELRDLEVYVYDLMT